MRGGAGACQLRWGRFSLRVATHHCGKTALLLPSSTRAARTGHTARHRGSLRPSGAYSSPPPGSSAATPPLSPIPLSQPTLAPMPERPLHMPKQGNVFRLIDGHLAMGSVIQKEQPPCVLGRRGLISDTGQSLGPENLILGHLDAKKENHQEQPTHPPSPSHPIPALLLSHTHTHHLGER